MIRFTKAISEESDLSSTSRVVNTSQGQHVYDKPMHSRSGSASDDLEFWESQCETSKTALEAISRDSEILREASLDCLIPTLGEFSGKCDGIVERLENAVGFYNGDTVICTELGIPIQELVDDIELDIQEAQCP